MRPLCRLQLPTAPSRLDCSCHPLLGLILCFPVVVSELQGGSCVLFTPLPFVVSLSGFRGGPRDVHPHLFVLLIESSSCYLVFPVPDA